MLKRLDLSGSPSALAKHYRNRADQLRIIASEWTDSGIQEILLRVVRNYEHMAERSDKEAQLAV